MFRNFTPAAARALQASKRWAIGLGARQVEPEHLLRALLEEEDGRAVQMLTQVGLDMSRCDDLVSPPPIPTSEKDVPLSPHTEEALVRADERALERSPERSIATEDILRALLNQESDLWRLLERAGADVRQLVSEPTAARDDALEMDPLEIVTPVSESIDRSRILDAAANRAREALRVIEDYARFARDDGFMTRLLKEARHALADALIDLGVQDTLVARDTTGDVGTALTTPSEDRRHSLADVIQANFKRLQESLRSLEEYGKIGRPDISRKLEALRYQAYTLERALLLSTQACDRLADIQLYVLLTGSLCNAALDWTIKEAVAGGAQMFQLREKLLNDRELLERARAVRRWTRQEGALFIMNDRPDIARLAEADGVHVGQEELRVMEARRVVGGEAIIGVSTHSIEQARQAVLDGASYIGVGPTFASETKAFESFPGLEFVRQVSAEIQLPTFAIGGIGLDNVSAVVGAGARRIAVSRVICSADDPRQAAMSLRKALEQAIAP